MSDSTSIEDILGPRPEITRGHATLECAYPAGEETFTGLMMLRIATGAYEDTDELVDGLVEMAEEFEEYFPDVESVAPAAVPTLFQQVLDEYKRVVPTTSYDAYCLLSLTEILPSAGLVLSWGDGFDSSEALEVVRDLADQYAEQGIDMRGYVYAHTQDLERLVLTGDLYLGFGVLGPRDDVAAVAVGRQVVDVLRQLGLPFTWDGTVGARILVAPVLYEIELEDETGEDGIGEDAN